MENKNIFFVTGVNGVGKTAVLSFLKNLLPKNEFEIFDFDQRGVPENADKNWRISETKYWIEEGKKLSLENRKTIICGFVKLTDVPEGDLVNFILLDAQSEIIEKRLKQRYSQNGIFDEKQVVIGKPIQEFIAGNLYILGKMREMFQEKNYPIIDTSDLSPEEVAKKISEIIL